MFRFMLIVYCAVTINCPPSLLNCEGDGILQDYLPLDVYRVVFLNLSEFRINK